MFSLIETAKENVLDPYRYLTCVLTEAPKCSAKHPADDLTWAASLTPQNAPETCKAAAT